MASQFLVDSNILVYGVDRRELQKQAIVVRLLRVLALEGVGAVSAQTLGEFVHASLRLADPLVREGIVGQAGLYASALPVLAITAPIVLEAARAVRDHGMSYWDAQVWATAKLNQIP